MKRYKVIVHEDIDDEFDKDITQINIMVISLYAKLITNYDGFHEYMIMADDKQVTMLLLKGYDVRETPL
jgi:hypothetical protein